MPNAVLSLAFNGFGESNNNPVARRADGWREAT